MSVQAVNQLLGPGKLYVKRTSDAVSKYRLIGSVKEATFVNEKEEVEQKPGDSMSSTRRDKVEEKASLKCRIIDFRMDQMINALGLSISRTQLTLTTSHWLEKDMSIGSTTGSTTFSQTLKSLTSVAFTSLDRATDYVNGTDYTIPTVNHVAALVAGFATGRRRAFWNTLKTTTKAIRIGGSELLQNVSVMFVHTRSNGKQIGIHFPIANAIGEMSFEFREKDYTAPEITFAALADPTLPKGRQLYRLFDEQ